MLLYLFLIYAAGSKAYVLINQLAVFEKQYAWQVHNAVFNRYFRILIAIELPDIHAAFIVRGQCIDGFTQHQAGWTPCSPKVNYGQLIRL